jgi:hypothetical protein
MCSCIAVAAVTAAMRTIEVLAYMAVGLSVTIVLEALATDPLDRWSYGDHMPRLPWFGTGILPVLQWLLLPLPILWLVRNQVLGTQAPVHRGRQDCGDATARDRR